MAKEVEGQTFFSTMEACQMAGISRSTLFRWIKGGVLRDAYLKDRNGWRLFSENDISAIRSEAVRTHRDQD